MILVFGGTTEGKQVIEVLNTLQKPFVYSTKTNIKAEVGVYGTYRSGAFTQKSLEAFIKEQAISLIIHASHPFAEILHKTIAVVANKNKLPVYRLERKYPKRKLDSNIKYVGNYAALKNIMTVEYKNKKCLFLTGVQTIERLQYFWKHQKSYFRILDRQLSIDIAAKSHFPKNQLILGMPNKKVKEETELINSLGIELIVTKESGESGALSVKIEAAKQCNVPIIIIEKPMLPATFTLFKNKETLKKAIQSTRV